MATRDLGEFKSPNAFADNQEPRCPCLLLLDTSGSMSGKSIDELNAGIKVLEEQLKQDELASLRTEVAIITFGDKVEVVQDFIGADTFIAPVLATDGGTPMGAAMELGLQKIEERKQQYRQNKILYYRPWVFLITDGAPGDDWRKAAALVHSGENQKKFSFYTIGVEGADMSILNQISPPGRSAVKLNGLNFTKFFEWLSRSMEGTVRSQPGSGEQIALQPISGWASTTA